VVATKFGFSLGIETLAHLPQALYGALIIVFLLIEPLGSARSTTISGLPAGLPFGYTKK